VSRTRLAVGLGITIALDTVAQLVWKAAALQLPAVTGTEAAVRAVLQQPLFLALAALFLLQLWVWLKVLEHADLSFAQPVTALSYVTVCGLSMVWFGETLDIRKLAGIGLVLLGVWFVSRGPARNASTTGSRS
jgi:drug/metabolite transporter (DMT)-like permease